LGALAASVALEWLLLLSIGPKAAAWVVATAAVPGIVFGLRAAYLHGVYQCVRRERPWWPLAAALLPVLLAFFSALYRPLDHTDERLNFAIKAKVLFHEGRLRPLTEEWVPHPRYPLLVPLLEVLTSGLSGRFDELAVKPPFAAYFGALVLLFYGETRRRFGPTTSGLFTSLLAWLPYWTLSETGSTSAGGDVPVACHLLALLVALRWCIVRPGRDRVVVAALLTTGLAFTKNEGLALVAFAALGILAWTVARRRFRPAGFAWLAGSVLLTLVLLAPWWWMVYQTPADLSDENYPGRLTVANLQAGLPRVPVFLKLLAREALIPVQAGARFWRPAHWTLTWWTLPFALAALGRTLVRDPAASLASLVLACFLSLLVLIWMITPFEPETLAGTALPRLLGQVAPVAWWMVVLAWARKFRGRQGPCTPFRKTEAGPDNS
jgi:hypothetical protein